MRVKYKLVPNAELTSSEEQQTLHVRAVSNGTIRLTELMERGSSRSTFSNPDIKGALQLIADLLVEGLKSGYSVELDGIGYFSLSLECRPETNPQKIRSQSILFRGVNFRANKELKYRLKGLRLYRHSEPAKKTYSPQQKEERLWRYLTKKSHITTREYCGLNNCSKYKALKELKQYVADGRLRMVGPRNNTSFTLPDPPQNAKMKDKR